MKYYCLLLLSTISLFCTAQFQQLGKDTDRFKWQYGINIDRMTSDTTYFAAVDAKEKLDFGTAHKPVWPTLMAMSGKENTTLSIEAKADFVCDASTTGKALIRIDNNKAFEAEYTTQPCSGTIFFIDAVNLINQLRNANVILIQADFIAGSGKVMEFDATSLNEKMFKNIGIKRILNNWEYDKAANKMTSDTGYVANCRAKHDIVLKSDDNRLVHIVLGVVYEGGVNKLCFGISGGKYALVNNSLTARIRFDNDQPVTVKCLATNIQSQLLFDNSAELVDKLIKSKSVLVEMPFDQDGTKIIEFDTHGLVWNHQNKK